MSRSICNSASWDPVDTSKDLILLSFDATKICWPSLDHARVPRHLGLRVMSLLLVSKRGTELPTQAVATRSPVGENRISMSCLSGPTTRSPVEMLQMLASLRPVPVANLVESGEMSTAHTMSLPSTLTTFSHISPSHMLAPLYIPHTTTRDPLTQKWCANAFPFAFRPLEPLDCLQLAILEFHHHSRPRDVLHWGGMRLRIQSRSDRYQVLLFGLTEWSALLYHSSEPLRTGIHRRYPHQLYTVVELGV